MVECNIKCDQCGKEFKLTEKNYKKHWLDKDKTIEKSYFNCPKCKQKYTVCITDPEVRAIMEDCKVIERSVKQLLDHKQKMMTRAKKKALELESKWIQQN